MSRHFELLYNMGIQLLHCGKAMPAFDCLVEAVQVFRSNPRLWLRLAECCIMANRQNNDEDRKLEKRLEVIRDQMAVEFTGSLDWARDSKKITQVQGLQLSQQPLMSLLRFV